MMRNLAAGLALAALLGGCGDDPDAADAATGGDGISSNGSSTGERRTGPPAASFDPDDATRFAALVRDLGLAPVSVKLAPRDRTNTDDRGTLLLFPRGKVRAADLASYRIDTDWAQTGTLKFARGGETLHEETLTTEELVTEKPVPAAVRDALRPGDRVVWTFTLASGEERRAEFEFADVPDWDAFTAKAAKRIDATNVGLLRQACAEALVERGFHTAAYREARAVALDAKSRPAWRIAQAALVGLGTEVSRLGDEAREALDKLDEERAPPGRRK